jgi:DNA-directed RNA polymerase subunit RPC12/RpoP
VKLHDELVFALTQPDGKGGTPLTRIVGLPDLTFKLEDSSFVRGDDQRGYMVSGELVGITPDIVAARAGIPPTIAIEVETGIKFDFGESLRQVKKYLRKFETVFVVIPKELKKPVPLYKNEGIRVCLWEASWLWKCSQCNQNRESRGSAPPRCPECNREVQEQQLDEIRDVEFVEA